MSTKCWARVWDGGDFEGPSFQFDGPGEWSSLRDLEGQDWHDRILSVEVGADAVVECFHDEGFSGKRVIYGPFSRIPNVGADMRDEFDSVRVFAYKEYRSK